MKKEPGKSYLELVEACDRFPYDEQPDFYKLYLPQDTRPHGMMRPEIVKRMPWSSAFSVDHAKTTVQLVVSDDTDLEKSCVSAFDTIVSDAIDNDLFEILHRRHSEPYRIVGANYFCHVERFSHALFGIVARGAHMTAYVQTSEGIKIWVPRRSRKLFTYPGKLDSTVAGGVKASDDPVQCITAEAMEEASIPGNMVAERLRSVGTLTYITMYDSPSGREKDLISPEILYLYDMELPADFELKPNDDEVEQFYLMSVDEVKQALANEEFKTNSAAVMVDFFVRHGVITQENEASYVELISRMHRRLPLAVVANC
ncbi:hypothetical protein BT63DRAFT_220645 [Microthyrium microscopicum]|uniref:Nudix hydrolase domain-containing protein n=1 Tax=Microthyrium microscopicum TaxID=703497 RepID=A0A6A6UKF5_9PEZI|nr:hypothetical protein BT63DRAFT_220645 [Microthyrium microscopicum]